MVRTNAWLVLVIVLGIALSTTQAWIRNAPVFEWSLPALRAQQVGPARNTFTTHLLQGISPGHVLRACVGNSVSAVRESARMRVDLSNTGGELLVFRELNVPDNGFACADVGYAELSSAAENGTGRVQIKMTATLAVPNGSTITDFVASVELFDETTGSNNSTGGILGFAYLTWGAR